MFETLSPVRQRQGLATASFRSAAGGLAAAALFLLAAPTLIVVIVSFTSGLSLRFRRPDCRCGGTSRSRTHGSCSSQPGTRLW